MILDNKVIKKKPNVSIQVCLPLELKRGAEAVFQEMGLSTSEAVRVFLKQSVNCGGLPFNPRAKRPNAETIEAMMEAENPESLRLHGSFSELRKEQGFQKMC